MLKKKNSHKVNTIVSVDPYTKSSYALKGTNVSPNNKLSYKKSSRCVTYLATKDMIIAPVEIGIGLVDQDLDSVIEDIAYEELDLDPTAEYIINHIEIPHEGNGRLFQLFVIEQKKYREVFAGLQQQVKYIDLIVPAPLLYKTLYDLELIQSRGVHGYLYFTKSDTFLTFYKDGEYLYSKSIKYSLEYLYNRYCEMMGATVDEELFFKTLQTEGLKATEVDYQQNITKLFGEALMDINDIIIYAKRAYNLDEIDTIFTGSSLGSIIGLENYMQSYLGIDSVALEHDFSLDTKEQYVDQLHLMMLIVSLGSSTEENMLNLTQYTRPSVFFKRPSGQFVSTNLIVAALALVPPSYYYLTAKANETRNLLLRDELDRLSKEEIKYKRILGAKAEEMEALNMQIKQLQKVFRNKEKTLISVYDKKIHYKLKSKQLKNFTVDLAKYNIKIYKIETKDNLYLLSLVASHNNSITQLIRDISEKYNDSLSIIDIELMQKDKNSTLYQGVLKVGLE